MVAGVRRDGHPGARRARRVVLLVGLLVASGCYSYTPVSNPAVGTTVRVRVPVTSAVDDRNAAQNSVLIEGDVVESRDTLVLTTTNRQEYGAYREITLVDTIRLAPDQFVSLEQGEFSTGRTAVLTIAIVAGATALALGAFGGESGGSGGGEPPPPTPQGAVVISNSFVSGVLGLLGLAR